MNGSSPKQSARDLLTEAHPALVGLSHWIHANPELGYEETLAAGWVAEWLTTAGFEVQTGIAGMETALSGSFGPGPFHVVICAEYDALPSVGHACGHNVIAASSVGAAIALAAAAEQLGLRITLLGTPAEEGGGGKIRLIQAGAFEGVHAALMVHPGPEDVADPQIIAVQQIEVAYTGREAHASAYPEEGINAADAMVIAQAAIGLLRQQLQTGDRVHGIVTSGGEAPNIIPAHTTARFMTRAATRERLVELTTRVRRCFEAGALATGAQLSFEEGVAYAQMVHDPDLLGLYVNNAQTLGRVFDPAATLIASTDMGDVSHVVPSIHPIIGINSRPAVNHQPDFATAAVSEAADQAIFDGALSLAWTVIDAAQDVALRERLTGASWGAVVANVEAEATTEIVDAYVVVEEYVLEPIADAMTAGVEAEASTDETSSDLTTAGVTSNTWSSLETTEAEAAPAEVEAAPAEAVGDAWVTAAEPERAEAQPSAEIADPWVEPAADSEAQPSAEMADPWAEPFAAYTPSDAWVTTSEPETSEETAAATADPWAEPAAEAEVPPTDEIAATAEMADPWAEPVAEAEVEPTAEVADPWAEPAAEAVTQPSAEMADPWAQPAAEVSATTYEWTEPATEAVAEPDVATADSTEAAPGHGYEFRQGDQYQPVEPVAEGEATPEAVTDSTAEMEWVSEPVLEPVAESGPMYSWYQPTTTEATRYEAATDAPLAESSLDAWTEPVTEADPQPVEAVADTENATVNQWSETSTEAVAESEPVAEPEPVYEWMQPTATENEPVAAVAENEPVEASVESPADDQRSEPAESVAEPVEAVAEPEPAEAVAEPVEAVAEPEPEPAEAAAEPAEAVAESTESPSEYAWMQPVEAEAEVENIEAVAEFEAVAEAEPVADEQPVEAPAQGDSNPFDSWAQQSPEQPYLNGQSHEHEPAADVIEQPTNSWANSEPGAAGDVWTQLGADASAEPFAEFAEQPVTEAPSQPVADAWGEPVAEIHTEGHNGTGDGNGNGNAWHDAPAEQDTDVAQVEAQLEPVTQPVRSWSAEHASWETEFADALAELDARPTLADAWSTTASSEDAPHWGGVETESWDEAARID